MPQVHMHTSDINTEDSSYLISFSYLSKLTLLLTFVLFIR